MRNAPQTIPCVVLALALAGCNGGEAQRIAELEAERGRQTEELRKARERYDQQVTEFTASVRERHAREIQELETRMADEAEAFTRTIHSLQAQLKQANQPPPETAGDVPPPQPAPAAPPPLPRIITRTVAPADAEFPIVISGVQGAQAVVGSHTSTRIVETDEEYRDAFGAIKKRKRPETYEIPEYGYQVSTGLANTSTVPVAVVLRCGQGESRIELGPGEERQVIVDAARGAPLVVRANGRTRSLDVTYP